MIERSRVRFVSGISGTKAHGKLAGCQLRKLELPVMYKAVLMNFIERGPYSEQDTFLYPVWKVNLPR